MHTSQKSTHPQELTQTLAFIGAGNMAGSIIHGLVESGWPAQSIIASEPDNNKLSVLATTLGIQTTNDNAEAIAKADLVMLAVKPQIMQTVLAPLAPMCQKHKPLIISIAAGISEQAINRWLGGDMAIVRCMPNTPALLQQGASGLYANPLVSADQKALAEQVMNTVGLSLWVNTEEGIDDVTALSGSAPAYFFLMMEAMIATGEKFGVSKEVATQLVTQTALGAAMMAKTSTVDIAELRRQVTSPGGTTEQAIIAFEQGGLMALVDAAMTACKEQAKQLAAQLDKS